MARRGGKVLLVAAMLLLGVSSTAAEGRAGQHHPGHFPALAYLLETAVARQGPPTRHHRRGEL
ncbi:hypothetical protein ACVIHB_003271 [Bradyrhizobium liaoningense]